MRAILLFFLHYFSPNKMLNLAECLWRQCLSDQNQNVGFKKKKGGGSTIHKLFHDTWKIQRWFRRFHLAFRWQKIKKQKTPGTSTSELGLVLLASSHPMVRHCDLPLWRRPPGLLNGAGRDPLFSTSFPSPWPSLLLFGALISEMTTVDLEM